jgi:hypothetical protein
MTGLLTSPWQQNFHRVERPRSAAPQGPTGPSHLSGPTLP